MTSITGEYLVTIIARTINQTIEIRRRSATGNAVKYFPGANEEIIDFIFSIPYFDLRLKDFLLGNLHVSTIIISQAWENEFIKKCDKWSKDKQWLEPPGIFTNKNYRELTDERFTLPY